MAERILVLGGTRSGKSAMAESLVADAAAVIYVATARPTDDELRQRVEAHRARRPAHWTTLESHDLGGAVRSAPIGAALLVDALGPWLAARMDAADLWVSPHEATAPLDEREAKEVARILDDLAAFWDAAAARPGGPVVVVADESGLGVLPAEPSTRRWLDVAGRAVQLLASGADRVLLVVAGRAVELTDLPSRAGDPAPAELRRHGDTMIPEGALDFAVNVHGDGPPAHIAAAIAEALDGLAAYPDPAPARAAIAARHGRRPDEVLVSAGAAEVFWLLPRAARIRLAAVVHPTFTEPEAALRHAGVPVTHVLRDAARGWALDPAAIPDEADLVVLGNPNNPTGTLDPAGVVASLCRPGRLVLVDEAFMDFTDEAQSLAGRADLPGLVVVRSITKLWGLAGVRGGYALAPPGLVARADAARQPWPVGADALAALAACAADEEHRRAVTAEVAVARGALSRALRQLPDVAVTEGAANFVLVRVPDGPSVAAALADRGIAVRTSTFPGLSPDHLRVAVRDAAANRRLVAALADVLSAAPPGARP